MNDATIGANASATSAHPVAAELEPTPAKAINWKSTLINVCAFAVAAASLVPHYRQVLEARSLNVPVGRVNQAQEQVELWQENKDCFKELEPGTGEDRLERSG